VQLTVAAGTFRTCRIEKKVGNLIFIQWLGEKIPFGRVKEVSFSELNPGDKLEFELHSFSTTP
jgi:hypothetical protein